MARKRKELTRTINNKTELPGALRWFEENVLRGLAGGEVMAVLTRPRRTRDQNDKMWPMLKDVATQCQMVINGEAVWADDSDWKDVFTAALRRHQRLAVGVDGGVVVLGMRTSKMKKAELSDLIELIYAYGAEHGVVWSEKSKETIGQEGVANGVELNARAQEAAQSGRRPEAQGQAENEKPEARHQDSTGGQGC